MKRILSSVPEKISLILFLLFVACTVCAQQGTLDPTFEPLDGPNGRVETALIQNDGKIIIVGGFNRYNTGVSTVRQFVARINSDASIDNTFSTAPGANNIIFRAAIDGAGKIIIAGQFTTYDGAGRNRIARLNTDGSLDAAFDPGTGANSIVRPVVVQSDGKILIGGSFTDYNGTAVGRLARLNADGSLDAGFNPAGTGAGGIIQAIALQPDGKIIIGGNFTTYNGTAINRIARLNADGSLDPTFNTGSGAENFVNAITLQSDGKIIIAGNFTDYDGVARKFIARLNSDGTLDGSFSPGLGPDQPLLTAIVQSDGKIIISGGLTTYGVSSRKGIARINADGSLDAGFNPGTGANGTIFTTAIQSDGKIIIGGDFTNYNGTIKNRIARLMNAVVVSLKFLSFTGTAGKERNRLVWKTANESHMLNYEPERSNNGRDFEKIASVNAENSNAQTYTFDDTENLIGKVFYRVKINESDGTVSYSDIITLINKGESGIMISPNPVRSVINVTTGNTGLLNTEAVIFDAKGTVISKYVIRDATQHINAMSLTGGLYFIKFANGFVQKFIKE